MAKDAKEQKKRKKTKYPNLDPSLNLKTRWEEVYDVAQYANKLSDKDKKWLNKFMGEYVNANLDVKNLEKNLHNTQELKKSCQDRNNARNRDIYTRAKASGNLDGMEEVKKLYLKKEQELGEVFDNFEDHEDESPDSGDSPDHTE
jgi:hypothetical protein